MNGNNIIKTYSNSIHWFRKGLRLNDNPSLLESCLNSKTVYPLFILDPYFSNPNIIGVNRYLFLLQSLNDLDNNLKLLGSKLFIFKGKPENIFKLLFKKWNINYLTYEEDYEPYAIIRDQKINELAKLYNINIFTSASHTLNPLNDYNACNATTYKSFVSFFNSLPKPLLPVETPQFIGTNNYEGIESLIEDGILYPSVPTLTEMGYPEVETPLLFPGGETEALRRLFNFVSTRPNWVKSFEKPNTSPNSLEPSTTVLSPYLKFGCLSARKMYHELQKIYHSGNHSLPPVSLEGQLLWREFFYFSAYKTENFDKMIGNIKCKQIPWERNSDIINAWKLGQTGYPFIDAIMTQLRKTGWIHHLARHAVACFLTRGDLWQHWEEGVRVFDLYLLDSDWALNNANWQWLSCSNFFYQYFRVYSPVAFGKKTDPNGDYIRYWLPQLQNYPKQYIYEPWKAPLQIQRKYGCIIGVDYPERIVIHEIASKENLSRMKLAYESSSNENNSTNRIEQINDEIEEKDEEGEGMEASFTTSKNNKIVESKKRNSTSIENSTNSITTTTTTTTTTMKRKRRNKEDIDET